MLNQRKRVRPVANGANPLTGVILTQMKQVSFDRFSSSGRPSGGLAPYRTESVMTDREISSQPVSSGCTRLT